MLKIPFYDPLKSYEENFQSGPFGGFADQKVFLNKAEPQQEFCAEKVFLPFGIPAGPLVNGKFVKAALDKGFDLPVYKTVRSSRYPCYQWPNVLAVHPDGDLTIERAKDPLVADEDYHDPLSITNSFGVPSQAPDFWQEDLRNSVLYAKKGQAVIGSFQGTTTGKDEQAYISDFILAARLVKETGVKILEVNLSCPNEGSDHLLCFDIKRARKVIEAIKNEIGNTPLLVKIAYFQKDNQLRELVESIGKMAEGFAAINTIPAKIIDHNKNQALPGKGRLISGVCGAGIKWAGLEMTQKLKALREDLGFRYTIIGVGGVMDAADYQDYLAAGADAVMSATGAMWNPFLAQEIKQSIVIN